MSLGQRAKDSIKKSILWHIIKHVHPRYHRPVLALGAAKLKALLNPGAEAARGLARAYVETAKMRLHELAYSKAIADCGKALAHDPICADAYLQRGHAFDRSGKSKEAVADFNKALDLQPGQADVHCAIARNLMSDFEDPAVCDEAIRHYELAISLEPQKLSYYGQAGLAYFLAGDYKKSEDLWARAIVIQGDLAKKHKLDALGIRFVGYTWLPGIGNLALLDTYIKMGLLGLRPPQRTVLAFAPEAGIANACLLDYCRPHFEFVADHAAVNFSREDAKLLSDEYYATAFPDGKTRWFWAAAAVIQKQWETEKRPPLFSLSEAHLERGKACLKELGVPANAWYVGLHVREPGFYKQLDAAHPTTRDADVNTYLQAIRSITARGGWVIRMGDDSMRPLPPMDRVVDYAHSRLKSDWMDVFLAGSCRFFIGTQSGLSQIPAMFGVPSAWTNTAPGVPPYYGNDRWIPKRFWSETERRHLTFSDMFSAGLACIGHQRQFDCRGIRVVDNTPEELDALALEMLENTSGAAGTPLSPGDERRQQRLHQLNEAYAGYPGARLGRDFLSRHAGLFESESRLQRA
jgi:putative glycosyltransferase (TIGR04372 family)